VTRKAAWSSCVVPPRLKPGDTVAVCAPAGPVPREGLLAGLALLEARYKVKWDERLLEREGFLAGSDDRRAEELNRYLGDPDVRAIVCARGGYGVMRILDRLDAEALKRDPKLVVGFSDLTALLAWCVVAGRVRPVHGPMAVQLGTLPPEDAAWLFRVLEDRAPAGVVPAPAPLTRIGARGGGSVSGRVVAGNLEMLTRLIGTPWEMDLGASILVVEDVGERPYRVDRMFTQLHLGGHIRAVRGVVAGDFTRCVEPDASPPTVMEVVDERLRAFEIPGVAGLPFGHGARNLALPWGAKASLDLAAGMLVLEEPAGG
jgi:muramoyltetrapeptide carboxypeptidase